MSDEPDNPMTDPEDAADDQAEPSEDSGLTWPPAGEPAEPEEPSGALPGEGNWSEEIRKVDEAISELRRVNDTLQPAGPTAPREEPEVGGGIEEAESDVAEGDPGIVEEVDDSDVVTTEPPLASTDDDEQDADEAFDLTEEDLVELPASDATNRAEAMVAATLTPTPPAAETPEQAAPERAASEGSAPERAASDVACRVREKSEDELGQLWGSVFFSAEYPPPKAIIVTAARSGDGATQIAAALALVGAEANGERRIALVDFNLRNPDLADVLDIPAEPGLTDVLEGRCSMASAMRVLTLRNGNVLNVLTSGPPVEKPLGLLKSRQVQSLMGRLQERYDHTIIDVAAAGAHPDPQVIGSLVDGALFVSRAGATPRETVAAAKKRLDLAGVRCLGLVLNRRSDPIPGFLYRMT